MFKKVALLATATSLVAVVGLAGLTEVRASSPKGCVDGSKSSNIKYNWSSNNKITVTTQGGKAVCKDVTLFFSAFTMPDTWDGKGWNQTAVPQSHYASVSQTLKAGAPNQKLVMELDLDECKNMQVDLYYSPKQKQVTWTDKIGQRLVTAKHVKATKCEPPVKEIEVCDLTGHGLTTVKENEFDPNEHSKDLSDCDPVTPEGPSGGGEITDQEVPAELPKTGLSTNLLTALLTGFGTYAAAYRLRR